MAGLKALSEINRLQIMRVLLKDRPLGRAPTGSQRFPLSKQMNLHSITHAGGLLLGIAAGQAATDTHAQPGCRFTFFRGDGDRLHLPWSEDARHWTDLGDVVLKPTAGDKLMRDPQILRRSVGLFHMVWTRG